MKRVLILVAISLFLGTTTVAFQGGGGESTKKRASKKKEVTKEKTSGTKSDNTRPPRPPATSGHPAHAPSLTVDLGNNVKLELVRINAGSFQMGSDGVFEIEKPVHRVTISQPFYLGKYEVTQAQWQAVMGNNPSYFKNCGGNCPVEQVEWDGAQEFIKRLNARRDGNTYRLPTEAEWEYAARAGTTGDYAGSLDEMAWYGNNAGRQVIDSDALWRTDRANYVKTIIDNGNQPHPVGTKRPNAWGLYDMHGNVWEWVQDWFDADYYKYSPGTDPQGPNSGKYRGLRGGSWMVLGFNCRSTDRVIFGPGSSLTNWGFRLVCVARTQ